MDRVKVMTFVDACEILAASYIDGGMALREAWDKAVLQIFAEYCKGRPVEPCLVPAFEVIRLDDVHVAFTCERCGKRNRHGWPEGEDRGGHRWSHCERARGYNCY